MKSLKRISKMQTKTNLKRCLVMAVFLVAVLGMSSPVLAVSWKVTQVTDNIYHDEYPQISGTNVVWEAQVGGGLGRSLGDSG